MKSYVPYFDTQRKYKIITACSLRTSKQNKLRQTKNKIKAESYLNYTTIINCAFYFLIFYFSSDKLAKCA